MIEEWMRKIWENPKKRARLFTFIWTVSLFMLVLGFIIIAWLLLA
ncbi:MAG: hypothetical protein PWQ88_1060 [Candidatus Methanomethylophilaceae archaeon]|jgi:hypothetical protein|nr:hypothetical protein [Candidatus Methanomethylophilaceae archaeon]MDI3541326.1 hypothetical protein [Candidatus Methanomethylophilaceae archaeon]